MSFASGKNANFECDRCGFDFPYSSMKIEEGTKMKVCSACFDAADLVTHPQVKARPASYNDPEALQNARPQQATIPWERWTLNWENWGKPTGNYFTVGLNWEDLGKA